jgi:acyl carrier protein
MLSRVGDGGRPSPLRQKVIAERNRSLAAAALKAKPAVKPQGVASIQDVREWLLVNVAAVLEIDPSEIDSNRNLDEYGLDSMQSVCLSGDLERWLKVEISATAIWDYLDIDSLCGYLEGYWWSAIEGDSRLFTTWVSIPTGKT